jgi:hypothetical protein
MKREGQLWIKNIPDKPITKKPLEVRIKVKVQLSIGLPLLNPEELCLKLRSFVSCKRGRYCLAAQKLSSKTKSVARDFEA